MAGSYTLSTNDKGQFSFALKAGNGEVILRSEAYQSRAAGENGIASVRRNGPLDERYVRKVAADQRHYFNLRAANHQVIGTSQMYASAASRDAGIESVRANAAGATLKAEA